MDAYIQPLPFESERIIADCPSCGNEIYEGQECYKIDGELLCHSMECLVAYVEAEVVEA